MKCEGAKELFSAHMEGSIDYALTTALMEHIDHCASCKHDFDRFKQTWRMLDTLPEIRPPANFRHEVVMRAARMQHEESCTARKQGQKWTLTSILERLTVPRAVAYTAAAAAMAFMCVKGPSLYEGMKAGFSPAVQVGQYKLSQPSPSSSASASSELDSGLKADWQSWQSMRNSLWITVEPKENDTQRLYSVTLSINEKAFRGGVTCKRLWAQVWLLSPGSGPSAAGATEVWHGNILSDSPLLVPVVQGRGDPVSLLVTWRYRKREFSQVVYIPSGTGRMSSRGMYDFNVSGSHARSLYSALQAVSEEYGIAVIADANLKSNSSGVVCAGDGSIEDTLDAVLKPANLDWIIADHSVYVGNNRL